MDKQETSRTEESVSAGFALSPIRNEGGTPIAAKC